MGIKRKREAPQSVGSVDDRASLFLLKSEPDEYSIEDLERGEGGGVWEGVRNHVAKNVLKAMRIGDHALFYHSSCKVPAVVGVCTVAREAYPDPTQFEEGHKYFDPKSTREKPRWVAVDVTFVRRLPRPVTLQDIKQAASQEDAPPQLRDFFLIRRPRQSVTPVDPAVWEWILARGSEAGGG